MYHPCLRVKGVLPLSRYPLRDGRRAAVNIADYDLNATYKINLSGGQQRLKEAILYVADKGQAMTYFGAVKLNKILWRADFRAFYDRGQPVTGRQYQRLPLGPAPVEMPPIIREMLRDGLLEIALRNQGGKPEHRHVPKVLPVLKFFSADDLAYLDESVEHYRFMTGTETSDESHGIAWKTRQDGDPIPYQAAYFEDKPLSNVSLRRLAEIGRSRGWRSQ